MRWLQLRKIRVRLIDFVVWTAVGSMEKHGSVIGHLLSQVRIGMDLTKVVLPTFILERRSLLEMYADFFAHPDFFCKSVSVCLWLVVILCQVCLRVHDMLLVFVVVFLGGGGKGGMSVCMHACVCVCVCARVSVCVCV